VQMVVAVGGRKGAGDGVEDEEADHPLC
jgi:hypothetical protein